MNPLVILFLKGPILFLPARQIIVHPDVSLREIYHRQLKHVLKEKTKCFSVEEANYMKRRCL